MRILITIENTFGATICKNISVSGLGLQVRAVQE